MRSNSKHTTKELKQYMETFEELENDVMQYIKYYNTRPVSLKMGLSIPA